METELTTKAAPRSERIPALHTIARGAIAEAFDIELAKVMQNITDPNTSPDAKRCITITLTFKPVGTSREEVLTSGCVTSKLTPSQPVTTTMFISHSRGVTSAIEYAPPSDDQYAQ